MPKVKKKKKSLLNNVLEKRLRRAAVLQWGDSGVDYTEQHLDVQAGVR